MRSSISNCRSVNHDGGDYDLSSRPAYRASAVTTGDASALGDGSGRFITPQPDVTITAKTQHLCNQSSHPTTMIQSIGPRRQARKENMSGAPSRGNSSRESALREIA